ncbi:MAG: polyisoprenoid-binding protein YceI [Paraglaciecola sp.]|jgi:polyisoprenoid-binding protein YceI
MTMKQANIIFKITFYALLCTFFSVNALANWQLSNEQSTLYFISTKNQHISEIHHFTHLSGSLSEQGQLAIEIDLASVETGIDIRNTRMREKLFLVDKFPKATLRGSIPVKVMELKVGQSLTIKLPITLQIMGIEKSMTIMAQISLNDDGQLLASSTKPILISAADFGLKPGVELLQKIAGLGSIGLSVPVTFNVVFAK